MDNKHLCRGIEEAIALEDWSQRFYMKCLASTANPIARRMFESFAKQSCVARDRLDRLYRSYYPREYEGYAMAPARPAANGFSIAVPAGSIDETEKALPLLEGAANAAENISSLYRALADGLSDKTLKKFFSGLAEEKAKSANIMRMEHDYIRGTGCYTDYK